MAAACSLRSSCGPKIIVAVSRCFGEIVCLWKHTTWPVVGRGSRVMHDTTTMWQYVCRMRTRSAPFHRWVRQLWKEIWPTVGLNPSADAWVGVNGVFGACMTTQRLRLSVTVCAAAPLGASISSVDNADAELGVVTLAPKLLHPVHKFAADDAQANSNDVVTTMLHMHDR
jgi:hypothetical protein